VFTARYALSSYIKQIRFVFKGLIGQGISQCACLLPTAVVYEDTMVAVTVVARGPVASLLMHMFHRYFLSCSVNKILAI
jgi:hypothetical protein